MDFLEDANQLIKRFEETMSHPVSVKKGARLFTGVDLGTAYIVLAVVDEQGRPVTGAMRYAEVVKDGLIVDFVGARNIVQELKEEIEEKLGLELEKAGAAFPPGTVGGDQKAIQYVAEGAGFDVTHLVDEPTAANYVLGIKDGAVVDIGGGTTGVAIFNNGKVTYVGDEPTGGTHFTLVAAGAYGISFGEAEQLKVDPKRQGELFPVLRPVMEKVASIIKKHIEPFKVDNIYLAGGTSCFPGIETIVQKETGIPTWKPDNPFLVTPMGIALSSLKQGEV
jgi:ethanolamine utilization protein EutJ